MLVSLKDPPKPKWISRTWKTMINPPPLHLPLHQAAKQMLGVPSGFMTSHPPTQILLREGPKRRLVMQQNNSSESRKELLESQLVHRGSLDFVSALTLLFQEGGDAGLGCPCTSPLLVGTSLFPAFIIDGTSSHAAVLIISFSASNQEVAGRLLGNCGRGNNVCNTSIVHMPFIHPSFRTNLHIHGAPCVS